MSNKTTALQKQLITAEKLAESAQKRAESIRKKIESEKNKNKSKSIIDRVKTFKDVLQIAKPSKEELSLINYSGKSKRMLFAKHMMIISLISEVLNEGHKFSMKRDEYRYFPYFTINSSGSGLVFYFSGYYRDSAYASSAARLCLKSRELSDHAGTILKEHYENAIM